VRDLRSVVDSLFDGLENFAVVGHVERLEDERERSIVAADSFNGRLQVVESVLLDGGSELGAETASDRGLMGDDAFARLLDGFNDCLTVPRENCTQVNNLA